MAIDRGQRLNMLAIELLEHRGNYNPTQKEIDRVEIGLERMRKLQKVSLPKKQKVYS